MAANNENTPTNNLVQRVAGGKIVKEMFDLTGKTAIVTGGNGGIGLGIARGLAKAGANLVIAARNTQKTAKAEHELVSEFGVRVLGLEVDVQEEAQINTMAARALQAFKRVDILVNNAGINIAKMPQDYLAEEWDKILSINLRSAFLCSKAVYPMMRESGGGKIINIGSMTSLLGGAKLAPYGASKGGIVQLTRSLAVSWAPDNIQVNAILPGWITTDLTLAAQKRETDLRARILARTPAGRWGEPNDLQGAAIFLATSASDFVTGIGLPVDGGYSVMT